MKNTIPKISGARTKKPLLPSQLRAARRLWILNALIFFGAFLLLTFLVAFEKPSGMNSSEFIVGQPSPRTLFSPLELVYQDDKATAKLRQESSRNLRPVFRLDQDVLKNASAKAERFFEVLHRTQENLETQAPQVNFKELPFTISGTSMGYLLRDSSLDDVRKNIQLIFEQSLGQGVLDYSKKLELLSSGVQEIELADTGKVLVVRDILTPNEIPGNTESLLAREISKNRSLKNAIYEIVSATLVPNLAFDENQTRDRRKKVEDATPAVEEKIQKNELILQRGELITELAQEKMLRIQKKLANRKTLNQFLAAAVLVFVSLLMSVIYLFFLNSKILGEPRQILLFNTVILLGALLCKAFSMGSNALLILMPGALAPLLITLLLNARLGLLACFIMTFLIAPMANLRLDLMLANLLAGVAVTFSAIQVRRRSQFLKVGAACGAAHFSVLLAFQVFQGTSWPDAFQIALPGFANGFIVAGCVLILPVFETLFNVTTDITLLELSDLNHPLLKRMIVEAPGTYHHSLVVSTLAETACEAIGANALLARVGCYFHDIGKIPKAEYFTENQHRKLVNRHDYLAPQVSREIIMDHVRDGVELGRQYKLKERILRFIPEHQGTGVVYFFYRRAVDRAQPGETINPDDYRYPGPKPQSKETAVAMLSDSVEAASRSLKEPTHESIRELVRKIINDKFIDGQLDECDLTLKDLHKIQNSFVHNLMAIYHTRVSYPQATPDTQSPNLFKDDPYLRFPTEC